MSDFLKANQLLARRVAEYLNGIPTCRDATPVSVTIARVVYYGAQYVDTAHDNRKRLYLVGSVPASYVRRRKTCYMFEGDARPWYVACYSTPEVVNNPQFARFHPFGESFVLLPWDTTQFRDSCTYPACKCIVQTSSSNPTPQCPRQAIDAHESKPYTRVAAVLTTESGNAS